jgi:RNA methyltransferase, TrmH family
VVAAAKLHRHVGRKRSGRFLAEGPNLVAAALTHGAAREVFVTEAAAARFDTLLAGVDVPVHLVTERAAKALSDTVTPVGLVAICESVAVPMESALAGRPRLVVVVVGISEPGNAGTLIRLSHAMGAAAVVLAGHSVDPFNAKCLRASAGSVFGVPLVVAADSAAAIGALAEGGLQILAATVDGDTSLDDVEPLLGAPSAWVFGSEAHGLPADLALIADHRVQIPMAIGSESLNVAAAAAICLYLTARAQRSG